MSVLYVRLCVGFYQHRKTAKLRELIGEAAYWLPPRLWAYAAEHQPDGDFSKYSASELARLLDYRKDASRMLQALTESGFLDADSQIHDWAEHNAYHQTYSERAKKAARARWNTAQPDTAFSDTGKMKEKGIKKEKESKHRQAMLADAPSILPSNLETPEFQAAWADWLQHRREIKRPLTPTAAKGQLLKLADMGPERAIAALKHSIANGWQGIFEPQSEQTKGHHANTERKAVTDADHKLKF